MNKHYHYETILAFAEGKTIQERDWEGNWVDVPCPRFHTHSEYRIKPEPKPDVVKSFNVSLEYGTVYVHNDTAFPNLKLSFDGETGKLFCAEVIQYV